MDSQENVFNFLPDVETDMESSSHRERAFRMELDRSLNFVVPGPIWLKFEPHGAFCEKFESATFSDHFGLVPSFSCEHTGRIGTLKSKEWRGEVAHRFLCPPLFPYLCCGKAVENTEGSE